MAYGIKYTITQKLRDESDLVVNIYEKDYTGIDIYTYDAISLSLQTNSSGDEPLPAIISSQLNISFNVNTDNSGDNFPNLISFDDRRYFVKLYNGIELLWCGYLFNDYVQIPFTTGNLQVDLLAIDGISFLEFSRFNDTGEFSINQTQNILSIIAETLNSINYPEPIKLLTSCSYYAEGMLDRTNGIQNEPFIQTYQFRRDYQDLTYYEVLEKIITSFGCRLYQANGEWNITAINQMSDSLKYYTRYTISPTLSYYNSGTYVNNVEIEPYNGNNTHFINNSQSKLVRKGYAKLILNHTYQYPINYAHNGTFKGIKIPIFPIPYVYPDTLFGWTLYNSTGTIAFGTVAEFPESNFNAVYLTVPTSGPTPRIASITNTPVPPAFSYLYTPKMTGPSFNISLEHNLFDPSFKAKLEIKITVGSSVYYYNSNNVWQTSQTFVTISTSTASNDIHEWITYSLSVEMAGFALPSGYGTSWEGYITTKVYVDSTPFYSFIYFRNFRITQDGPLVNSLKVTRKLTDTNTTIKELEQPYGTYYKMEYTVPVYTNNLGVFYDVNGNYLKNWRELSNIQVYLYLQMLIAKQLSKLLNKNFATLEGDLGKFKTDIGLNYLDKTFTVQDSITNALTFNGKKFECNRATILPYFNEVNSFQIIEISNEDNASTEIIEYVNK